MTRRTLTEHVMFGCWAGSFLRRTVMRAVPRGPFAVATVARPGRRAHLVHEALTVWQRGKTQVTMADLERIAVALDVPLSIFVPAEVAS